MSTITSVLASFFPHTQETLIISYHNGSVEYYMSLQVAQQGEV